MSGGAWRQYRVMVGHGARAELADPERLVSPVLFAVTLLLLFSFAVGELDGPMRSRIFVAETFLTALFALQISFARLFDPDRQDRVYDVLRSYPVSFVAWFLARYTLVLLLGALTLAPTMLAAAFLNQSPSAPTLLSWPMAGVAALALAGLAALGVLLSAMTLKAHGRQVLYPLLYFPLTTPVLLAAVQASLIYAETGVVTDSFRSWGGVLLAFNVIYITLGILLFPELVDES